MILDRALAMRGTPGFGNVANIVTNLTKAGFVVVSTMPHLNRTFGYQLRDYSY